MVGVTEGREVQAGAGEEAAEEAEPVLQPLEPGLPETAQAGSRSFDRHLTVALNVEKTIRGKRGQDFKNREVPITARRVAYVAVASLSQAAVST